MIPPSSFLKPNLVHSMLSTISPPTPLTPNPNPNPRFKILPFSNARRSLRICSSLPDPTEGAKVEYTPWIIAGLGNPGSKYQGTRHNVGFEMVDRISREEGIPLNTIQSKALLGVGSIGEVPVLLVKPQTYMNFSGESVGSLAAYYQVPLRHILLIYDEMSLPNGVMRIQQKGGHGHHNGVKSVMEHLDGCRDFPRLCIGIGNSPGSMDMRAYLLQKFSAEERKQVLQHNESFIPNLCKFSRYQQASKFCWSTLTCLCMISNRHHQIRPDADFVHISDNTED